MFAEVTRQVRIVNDMILSNMKNGKADEKDNQEISKHLEFTRNWFIRISWANKKRFLLVLIDDVQYIWTISLLLKSIWNCRPKDAVMSFSEQRIWNSYDQVPMDNDRTALPPSILNDVMMSERIWFQSLESEEQAFVLTELVKLSGGPIMWEVLNHAQQIYERHVEYQLQNLQECEVVYEPPPEKKITVEPVKKDQTTRRKSSATQGSDSAKSGFGQAQKELEMNLSIWASTIKSMKDSMKLEEFEMTFKDETKKKIWKVNRPKPEIVETVDIIQLLPSSISKRIFMYIPVNHLGDCSKVNKYWAYLVDEIKAELVARQKIDIELDKLRDIIMRHDVDLNLMSKSDLNTTPTYGSSSKRDAGTKMLMTYQSPAKRLGLSDKRKRKPQSIFKPIRNMADCTERLELRGAADENIWKWCTNIIKMNKKRGDTGETENNEGLLTLVNTIFPCPLMSQSLKIPLNLAVDFSKLHDKSTQNVLQSLKVEARKKEDRHRYTLWSIDFSRLYPVCKVSSHQSPF